MFSADDAEVRVLVEQNDKVKRHAVEKAVADAHQALEAAGQTYRQSSRSSRRTKGDLLPYADALLRVMSHYLKVTTATPGVDTVRYKSLEMAFQLIFDNVRNKVWKGTDGLMPFKPKA